MNELIHFLEYKAYKLRQSCLTMTTMAGSGHPTSCLSAADLVAALFFYAMRFDPRDANNPDNDRFILSKGHAAPLLYAVYKELGVLTDHDLATYRTIDSVLEGHPTRRFVYAEAATGSLGMGLSIGVGSALAAKKQHRAFKTYVLLGDSETSEGSIWEAAALAHHYKLNNLVAILDVNRLGQSNPALHGHHIHRYEEKFKAFGWHVVCIDGHNIQVIAHAFDMALTVEDQPVIIIAKTIKGYGVARVQDREGFHGKPFSKEELHEILQQLATRFGQTQEHKNQYEWHPRIPTTTSHALQSSNPIAIPDPLYKKGSQIPTREAYGKALVALGHQSTAILALDAEVKNSTFAELFESHFPDRFIECFVAEQNMIGIAVGCATRGYIPFASTFGAFMTRAHDQIRMAAIGQVPLRIVGSHAGVSIGQDGPSQMALEDIGLMRSLPESVVLYPCDAVSTHKLVEQMANYSAGISYLRTTRGTTPVIYDFFEQFPIGGCKVLRQSEQDVVCIVAAGITVFEALKAYDYLMQEGIAVAVIDLYSIKPLDVVTLRAVGLKSGSTIVTVEDHYLQGGLGEAVAAALANDAIYVHMLAVKQLPRSGTPDDLLRFAGIDANSIITTIKNL